MTHTPTNPISHLPRALQMTLLRADIKTIRQARGPLRRDKLVRAHFWNRLMDAKAVG
jgi:hypothetical protein